MPSAGLQQASGAVERLPSFPMQTWRLSPDLGTQKRNADGLRAVVPIVLVLALTTRIGLTINALSC